MRLRLRFCKVGKIRFIGHRDVARVTERAVRKVGLAVTYSEGFSPRMKLSFGLALPTGYESAAEFLDLRLLDSQVEQQHGAPQGDLQHSAAQGEGQGEPVIACRSDVHAPCGAEPDLLTASFCSLAHALSDALPIGMSVSAVVLTEAGGPSLQSAVHSCGWRFEICGLDADRARVAVEELLASDTVVTERVHKGKTVSSDVRPYIGELRVDGQSERGAVLSTELSAKPRVVRPSELVPALAPAHEMGIARRTHQWTWSAAGRTEPVRPAQCAQRYKEILSG